MELRKVGGGGGYGMVIVILLFVFAIGCTEGKRRAEMVFINGGLEMTEEMEQAWIYCSKELIDYKNSFGYDLPPEGTNRVGTELMRRNMQKTLAVMPAQLKKQVFDCLAERNLLFGSSVRRDSFMDWVIKCFELLVWWPYSPRLNLASKSYRHMAPIIAPSLAPALSAESTFYNPAPSAASPFYAPEHAALFPFYGQEPAAAPPTQGPAPAAASSFYTQEPSNVALASSPPNPSNFRIFQKLHYYQHATISKSPRKRSKHSLRSSRGSHVYTRYSPQPQKNIASETLIAVAATAIVTFCFVGMMFCCWLCCKGSGSSVGTRYGQRDDRPLLHLSDFSASSSQNSVNLDKLLSKEPSFNSAHSSTFKSTVPGQHGNPISPGHEVSSSDVSAGEIIPPLKPPPGRAIPVPAPPTPGPPPVPPPAAPKAPPPPPPKASRAPPAPPSKGKLKPSPLGPRTSKQGDDIDSETGAPKAKLKPFFWDKVMANPDQSMVWHEISAGSFQFNEEMIESLFGYNAAEKNKREKNKDLSESSVQFISIIDKRKAQNLSILLRALNVTTEEVVDALKEGNELPVELMGTLLKMAPTAEEELKLRLFAGDITQLGPAERFLKILVEIPFAFKRIESLLFRSSVQEDVTTLKESFATLEVACNKLKNSRLFLKLLEAVLKTGNRMNDGTYRGGAQAFRLDTLLKLSDVKGTDGKTTLLHFVVQEIIRSEGIRAVRTERAQRSLSSVKSDDFTVDKIEDSTDHYCSLGLKVISGLSNELEDVKKAAVLDADDLTSTLSKLRQSLVKTKGFLDTDMKSLDEKSEFYGGLVSFVERVESDIPWLLEEEKRIMALVKSTADYFHGHARKDEGLRLFTIVRKFIVMVDKICKEISDERAKKAKITSRKESPTPSACSESRQDSAAYRQLLFPTMSAKHNDSSSSDDESSSP